MELHYFKTGPWGDCYAPNGKTTGVISIQEKDITLMAFDETRLEGLYDVLKVSQKEYNTLHEFAANKERKKGMNLLRKIHENNPHIKDPIMLSIKEITLPNFNGDYQKLHEIYVAKKPILK